MIGRLKLIFNIYYVADATIKEDANTLPLSPKSIILITSDLG